MSAELQAKLDRIKAESPAAARAIDALEGFANIESSPFGEAGDYLAGQKDALEAVRYRAAGELQIIIDQWPT